MREINQHFKIQAETTLPCKITKLKSEKKLKDVCLWSWAALFRPCTTLVCQPTRHQSLPLQEYPFPHSGHMAGRHWAHKSISNAPNTVQPGNHSVLLATQEQQNEWLWPPWDLDCGFQRLELEGKFAAWSFRDSRQSYADKGKCALQYEHRVFKSELYTHWEGEEHESWVNPPNEHWIFAFP